MNELTPPRSVRATVAAIIAIFTGCYWTVISGSFSCGELAIYTGA